MKSLRAMIMPILLTVILTTAILCWQWLYGPCALPTDERMAKNGEIILDPNGPVESDPWADLYWPRPLSYFDPNEGYLFDPNDFDPNDWTDVDDPCNALSLDVNLSIRVQFGEVLARVINYLEKVDVKDPNDWPRSLSHSSTSIDADSEEGDLSDLSSTTHRVELSEPNRLTDANIRLLATSGRICAVMGHQWKIVPWTYAMENINGEENRHCIFCGQNESRYLTEWAAEEIRTTEGSAGNLSRIEQEAHE